MAEEKIDFTRPEYYQNRELSWIAFNYRVLGAGGVFKGYGPCRIS